MLRTLFVVLLLCASLSAQQPVTEWIRSAAIRLQTPEAGHGFADMQPLKKVVGDARIVSLGEATHGTREFFQLKHRMVEFLATEMGFTIFSIEANMPEAYALNDFVLNGKGDPAKLIKGMYFWTWDTQEVLQMVLWMREFNKSGKGRIEFTGFDMQTPNVAAGIGRDFIAKSDPDYLPEFEKAHAMALAPYRPATGGQNFGVATGTFPVKDALGKTVRFSGYIKTENVTNGFAGLWWRIDGPTGDNGRPTPLGFDNMQSRGVKGTTEWKQYTIEMPVPANAVNINFGALLPGEGTAWFDTFTVELDGKPYQTTALDLDFETLTGFYAGGNGYRATLDADTVHSGKRSLRISSTGAPKAAANPNAVDPKTTAETWQQVVEHMESSREAYRQKGLAAHDIEWAIQNARVTLQCMRMRTNEVSRDASMAANVKWILEQNPEAKIVLWAHNGHVTRQGAYASMGAALTKMYGPQMVVFGFAFHQGSFQAVSQQNGLKDFTVPPAPAGSLDATLASAGIPLFALDLRKPTGAAAEWLAAGHESRNIGAVYPDDQPFALMYPLKASEAYDALFFVEKTTAARKNPALNAIAYRTGVEEAGATTFTDPDNRATFTLPAGWKVTSSSRWGNNEATAILESAELSGLSLYYRPRLPDEDTSAEARQRVLAGAMEAKVAQRNASGVGYRARPDGCQARTVGGFPARSCVGELEVNGSSMLEYLTWVETDAVHFLLFGRATPSGFDSYRKKVDGLLDVIRLH